LFLLVESRRRGTHGTRPRHFINGLKQEIKHVVQAQLPDTVDRVALLARI
jgi:hypothetical protein